MTPLFWYSRNQRVNCQKLFLGGRWTLTGAAVFGVDVAGPSLPVCLRVATILVLSQFGFNGVSIWVQCFLFLSPDQCDTGCATEKTMVVPTLPIITCLCNVLGPRYHFKSL